ncbi:TlpA disulfide reductase family protein [Malikia sp.]|uniref:TlpA disulfide reductase family protein n=1 Tax=Malikia sp. TaxID=2070706 RepID=UPI00262E7F31|nr:TlpA disulfide reductase family protein [Malikia sp.]MDD2730164.1 TlpA disulfide reductase family protein [Malikia sp.]
MKRRGLLAGGTAVAALAGVGLAGWRLRPAPPPDDVPADLWSRSWETPDGRTLAAAELRGGPLLLNFWATWCPPCVEELPLLDAFFRAGREQGWQVLGLAIDQPSAVRAFLGRQPLAFPVGLAGLGGTELARGLGNVNGGLPFSVLFDRAGALVERKLGRLLPQDLQRWRGRV